MGLWISRELDEEERRTFYRQKLGSIYAYAPTRVELEQSLEGALSALHRLLSGSPVWQPSYVVTVTRTDVDLHQIAPTLIKALSNYLCVLGRAMKVPCVSVSGTPYHALVATECVPSWMAMIEKALSELSLSGAVSIQHIQPLFSGAKGSYHWSRMALDHLVACGEAIHLEGDAITVPWTE